MIRVGYDVTPTLLGAAGVARYVVQLADAIEGLGSVELSRISHRPPRLGGVGGRVLNGLERELVFYPVRLRRIARSRRVDVVHCPSSLVPPRMSCPLVVTVHDLLPLRHPHLFTRANVLHHRLVVARNVRHATRVIVGSEHTRNDVIDLLGVSPERVRHTPYGIDPRFRPTSPDLDLLAQMGVRPPYLLFVGTLEPRKNLAGLVHAFSLLRRHRGDVTLVVVGAHGWRTATGDAALGAEPDGIVALGRVSDDVLVQLYGATSCFVFPSLDEGIGLPPLEAMACGAPVVASNRSSIPEMVGDAGLLVDPTDPEELAAAVESVVSSPSMADDLRGRGLRRAVEFTWERCARETVEVYREACSVQAAV